MPIRGVWVDSWIFSLKEMSRCVTCPAANLRSFRVSYARFPNDGLYALRQLDLQVGYRLGTAVLTRAFILQGSPIRCAVATPMNCSS